MLDEKIENGMELEPDQDSEDERHLRLQRVAEEWDTLLGKSQDSNDLQPPNPRAVTSPSSDHDDGIEFTTASGSRPGAPHVESSNDSMRTMFSNSVNLPAGTLSEHGSDKLKIISASSSPKSSAM